MNNCPKCGNPLQAGVTSCPICGTNIASESNATPVQSNVVVNSVSKPVATQTVSPAINEPSQVKNINNQIQTENKSEIVIEPVNATEVQTTPAQTVQQKTNDNVVQSQSIEVASAVQTPAQTNETPIQQIEKSAPQQAVQGEVKVVQEQQAPVNNVATQNIKQAPVEATQISSIAPTIAPIDAQSPIPSIPSSLNGNNTSIVPNQTVVNAPTQAKQKPKKKGNKNVLAISFVVLLLVAGVALYMTMGKGLKTNKVQTPQPEEPIAMTSVTSNGYKFELPEGWLINEDGTNVILTNSSETVAIKLDHSSSNIQNISKEMIESILKNSSFENSEVTELSISAKDAYSVNAKFNDLPVQIYFIGGGSNLTLGVTIVYQSEDSKTKYEADITEMMGTIAYSDESIKAISTMDMYSDIFNIYRGVVNESNKPKEETPIVDNNENNGENTSDENVENKEENLTPPENTPQTPNENPTPEIEN